MTDSYAAVLEDARNLLAERVAELRGPADLDEDALFSDVGIDSIDLVVVLTHFEQKYGVSFENEEVDVEFYRNLRTLAEAISSRIPA